MWHIFLTKTSELAIAISLLLLFCLSPPSNASSKQINALQSDVKCDWLQEDLSEKHKILKIFWQERIIKYSKKSVYDFKNLIIKKHFPDDLIWQDKIERLFDDAITKKIEYNTFFTGLQDQPLVLFKYTNELEKLVPEDQFEDIKPDIKLTDLEEIEQYIKEKHMSVAITLGSENNELITPDFPENLSQFPFAIHSIGKVFTGILTLLMIEEDILSEEDLQSPVQLDESVMQQLPSTVREQLKKVTLHQLMTHQSGLGDYLQNYFTVISQGNIPEIKKVEDFLPLIDDNVFPIGERRYSNAGILLVGLAIQYAYEKKFHQPMDYNDILQNYIIQKVGMSVFTPWKPENARYNLNDSIAPHIVASPAGGYWTTAEDLAKFGQWIYKKSILDERFKMLIEKYGQEFYHPDRQAVTHWGGIQSSNAFLSVSLKTGAIIAVLSDQPPGLAADLVAMVQTHVYSTKMNESNSE